MYGTFDRALKLQRGLEGSHWASVYGVADCGVDYYDVSTTEMIIVQKAWRTEARTLI